MQVNICLYGNFNNRYSKTSGAEGFEEISRLIRMHPDVEFRIFAYSNDLENRSEVEFLYGPLGAVMKFEPAIDTEKTIEVLGLNPNKMKAPKDRPFSSLLNFYRSRSESIKLMLEQPNASGADWVIVSRFDTGQVDRFNGRQRDKVSSIGFNKFLRKGYFYSAIWDQHNIGYADQWFIGSLEDIRVFANMYEQAKTYLKEQSPYLNHLRSGLHDSSELDEFSNERLKPEKLKTSRLLKSGPRKPLNGHTMHKFFFMDNGLYEKSRFSNTLGSVPLVVFSHSDYAAITKIYFNMVDDHMNTFSQRFLITESGSKGLENSAVSVFYDEEKNYVDRLIQGLVQIDQDIIFFSHEDMLITGQPSMRHVLDALGEVEAGRLDYFSFARGGLQFGYPVPLLKSVRRYVNGLSPWIFSIQPSFWNRKSLISLLREHRGEGLWEFEAGAQQTFRRLSLSGGFSGAKGKKRGSLHWESPLFPYIATAVVKGKLNWEEYPNELEEICKTYGLDPNWTPGR